ncbi:MAG: 4-hydroxyphenylpyruvate dioxygenase [Myxococcales bacterium]|nr:4-hydroxyphenylpyruvate dioxygenase [Myxococcales bacterium]
MFSPENPCGLRGIAFVEWSSPEPEKMHESFLGFGFSHLRRHHERAVDLYQQNRIFFLLNHAPGSFADHFQQEHGPSICGLGLMTEDPEDAFATAVERGARPFEGPENQKALQAPAVYGIGDSLIYFVSATSPWYEAEYPKLDQTDLIHEKGFLTIDHLTNNVYKGTMEEWSNFYKDIFGFTEVRTFDIRGRKTGLQSYALQSPCKTFCIPINEGTESRSQIEEYLREYKGPGVQHLAFLTSDLLQSLDQLEGSGIETLDIHENYYTEAFQRVPQVTEDREHIKRHQVLVDGDEDGYLLQIFTKNLYGPIFIELIQRKNHRSFGEGNFQALFESIERDQERRGVI